jgi:hypothetical protein
MMRFILPLFIPVLMACGNPCRGTYIERDDYGNLKKYNEYRGESGQCYKDVVALSQWEASSEARMKKVATCPPQPQFQSVTLGASGNYYSYRDGRMFLDLDASTGEYRKLILAEDKMGNAVFSRLQGCFYQRTATGIDSAFGNQILLDVIDVASSNSFDPMEIYQVTQSETNYDLVRFDSVSDWDFRFCPELSVPWE